VTTTYLRITIDGVEMLRMPWWSLKCGKNFDSALLGAVLIDYNSDTLREKLADGRTPIEQLATECRLLFKRGSAIGEMGGIAWGQGKKITIELTEDGQ
jgi:hypothetical protein